VFVDNISKVPLSIGRQDLWWGKESEAQVFKRVLYAV
jgi:hypothetical protein